MKDKFLDYIWSKQKEFNKNFTNFDDKTIKDSQDLTKEYVLHLISEVNSLLDEVNWKIHHKKDSVKVNRRELILEWVDIFKYWLSIGLIWDITPEEFVKYFDEKSDLVEQRFLQEFGKFDDKEVVICDIDGVLGDYPRTFLEFVKQEESKIQNELCDFSVDNVDTLDLYSYLEEKVPSSRLKFYKERYREEGLIRTEDTVKGAREFLSLLRSKGYYVVLLTSRPFDRYKNLYLDTYIWLRDNNLEFDMILNDSKKRDKIIKILETSRVKFVVDDDPKIVEGLTGITQLSRIYLVDRTYNRNYNTSDTSEVVRVKDFNEILIKEKLNG